MLLIQTVLIPVHPNSTCEIYGRPAIQRILLLCQRAGVARVFIECGAAERAAIESALAPLGAEPVVRFVDSFDQLSHTIGNERCLAISGNVVIANSRFFSLLSRPADALWREKLSGDPGAVVISGRLRDVLDCMRGPYPEPLAETALPLALRGSADDRRRAEFLLAGSLRAESADVDGALAHYLDRRISWRMTYPLASSTSVTPNQVTLANLPLGLLAAWMFSRPGYWWQMLAALVLLACTTIDGVDGEIARLKMVESHAGWMLDEVCDNIVNLALFVGIALGCYRAGGNDVTYLYLLVILFGGFGLCAIAVARALGLRGMVEETWIKRLERLTGRDFAYVLLVCAAIGHVAYVLWALAFGTYVFAGCLWWFTRRRPELAPEARMASGG